MTLGVMYDIVDAMELLDEFSAFYLRGAERKGGVFSWRHLNIEDLPAYLKRVRKESSIATTTWRQLQKALRWLVMCAHDAQVCTLPEGWFIETNTRDRRILWCEEWKEIEIATRVLKRITPDNVTDERIEEWRQLHKVEQLLRQVRQFISQPKQKRKRAQSSSPTEELARQESLFSMPALC